MSTTLKPIAMKRKITCTHLVDSMHIYSICTVQKLAFANSLSSIWVQNDLS